MFRKIDTAPDDIKDGRLVLLYVAEPNEPIDVDEHVYPYPKDFTVRTVVARWCEKDPKRSSYTSGWYAPWMLITFGPWDDPSTDFDEVRIEPTHYQDIISPEVE